MGAKLNSGFLAAAQGATTVQLSLVGLVLLVVVLLYRVFSKRRESSLPVVNVADSTELLTSKAKLNFQQRAEELMRQGFQKGWKKFKLVTDTDSIIVLSPEYAEQLQSDPRLSFSNYNAKELHSDIPGFDAFKASTTGTLLLDTVRTRLTQALGTVTEYTPIEVDDSLRREWTDNPEWHTVELYGTILSCVAQVTSRVFLGDELCRDPSWHHITIDHAISSFVAAADLRSWPAFLRPIVHWVLPQTRALRRQVAEARRILGPVIEKRKQEMAQGNLSESSKANAIVWFEDMAAGKIKYDPVAAQLILSVAAVHSTADLLVQTLIDISKHPELIEPMRQEIIAVQGQHGWTKAGLHNLKLMDSVLKESQRLKPIANVSMRRMAMEDITLKDGTFFPKGQTLCVSAHSMTDPANYDQPDQYDGYRFLKRAENPATAKTSSLVTPSPQHFGFGFGRLACPGRFLAGIEAKTMLSYILLRYDFRLEEGSNPHMHPSGFTNNVDHTVRLQIRRRKEEFVL
ncbi:hypothetical protein BBP40_010466 [Aspergillus hancockii]|nr:hypothetical protein BBP40_010466 [Aspergillus hancockii]